VSLFRSRKIHFEQQIIAWLLLAVYGLVVLGPILVLVISTLQEVFPKHIDWLSLAVPSGRSLGLLLNSLALALAVSFFSMLIGGMVAVKLWTWQSRIPGLLIWLVLPLAAIPPYIYAISWFALQDLTGGSLDITLFSLNRWSGSFLVMVAANSPITLGCTWLGLRMIDPGLIEIGRTYRSDLRVLLQIVTPLCAPALLTGGGIVFLLSLLDYSVPSLLGLHVYAMEIFAEFSASSNPQRAFLISLPLMILAVFVVIKLLEPLRTLTMRAVNSRPSYGIRMLFPGWFSGVLWIGVGLFILMTCSPLLVAIAKSGGFSSIALTTGSARQDFLYSVWMAGIAALLCIPLAMLAKRFLQSSGRSIKAGWLLIILPLAIPASLLGIGFILISNGFSQQPDAIKDHMPAIVQSIRYVPLAVLLVIAQTRRSDPLLQDAARVYQASWWRRQLQIAAPLNASGVLAGSGIVFALSMGELGATMMVLPPGRATLTMRIYNYLHYGASDTVAGLILILMLGIVLGGLSAGIILVIWSRLTAASEIIR